MIVGAIKLRLLRANFVLARVGERPAALFLVENFCACLPILSSRRHHPEVADFSFHPLPYTALSYSC